MARESIRSKTERLEKIISLLRDAYPDAKVGLDFTTPQELLIATILSAQCTDERVNIVTKDLFKKYRTLEDYVSVPQEVLEQDIRSTGFYRNKAKNIQLCAEQLIQRHDGEVPSNMDDLIELSGVGRKTANCVLSNCYGIPGITVDTHVTRISNLLGLAKTKDAVKIEFELMKLMPDTLWNEFNHLVITHGRRTCIARRPQCQDCPVNQLCPSAS